MRFSVKAPAKVNLCLAVEFPPQDGYHELMSVFQALDLHDTLEFACGEDALAGAGAVLAGEELREDGAAAANAADSLADGEVAAAAYAGEARGAREDGAVAANAADSPADGAPAPRVRAAAAAPETAVTMLGTEVALACGVPGLSVCDNLVFRAIDAAEQAFGMPFAAGGGALSVRVDKRIPAGGGLGGGSSDAAAALKAYARVHGLDRLDARFLAAARSLGADVAFFLHGGAALMGGRGDELVRALPAFPLPLVLMGDATPLSTARVYHAFDAAPPAAPDAHALAAALEGGTATARELALLCANNLEPAACAALPQLAQLVAFAKNSPHVLNALVTGSGATSYAVCENEQEARAFAQEVAAACDWVHVATPA